MPLKYLDLQNMKMTPFQNKLSPHSFIDTSFEEKTPSPRYFVTLSLVTCHLSLHKKQQFEFEFEF